LPREQAEYSEADDRGKVLEALGNGSPFQDHNFVSQLVGILVREKIRKVNRRRKPSQTGSTFQPDTIMIYCSLQSEQSSSFQPSESMHANKYDRRSSFPSTQTPTTTSHFKVFIINGCLNASAGVILFSGLSAKQRSSRSLNNSSSLISASLRPFDADMRRVRRSRVGLLNARVLIMSYRASRQ